jgi:hypothetical protein
MEGGAETGTRAAREVLGALGLPLPDSLRPAAAAAGVAAARAAVA